MQLTNQLFNQQTKYVSNQWYNLKWKQLFVCVGNQLLIMQPTNNETNKLANYATNKLTYTLYNQPVCEQQIMQPAIQLTMKPTNFLCRQLTS